MQRRLCLYVCVIFSQYGCAAYPIDDEDGDGSGFGWDATTEGSHHRHPTSLFENDRENLPYIIAKIYDAKIFI